MNVPPPLPYLALVSWLTLGNPLDVAFAQAPGSRAKTRGAPDLTSYHWNRTTGAAAWAPRAGLQAAELGNRLLVLGGRTPLNPAEVGFPGASILWNDVWTSDDLGATWQLALPPGNLGQFAPRAYFQAVTKDDHLWVLGGQNFRIIPNPNPAPGAPPFLSVSDFFNDVWRSPDGVQWTPVTLHAPWRPRAGLSSIVFNGEIYVLGGSLNDDDSIVGGPPQRLYFNDVWKSADGVNWTAMTTNAPWAPRAGAAVVVKNGWLYLLGGEFGFLCTPQPCTLPYFNDVWRTRDGARWELVTTAAGWSPRPGHQAVVLLDQIVVFGGFGLPFNPSDMWASRDGRNWTEVNRAPWNALSSGDIKYDFDALAVSGGPGGQRPCVLTFGGDRETFDFGDPLNYLRVDRDVWRWSPEPPRKQGAAGGEPESLSPIP